MKLAAVLSLGLLAFDAGAQEVFRCTSPDGKVTYQQAPCPKASEERKVDATPANTDFDPSKREEILKRGDEAGKRLEARAAKEEEERRQRAEARAREEQREREAREREEARDLGPYYYAWPPGQRPTWGGWSPKPPTPPGSRPTPLPTRPTTGK